MEVAVGFRRQMEGRVVDEHGPGLGEDPPIRRHDSSPVTCGEQQKDIDGTVQHPEQRADKVPVPGQSQRMAATRQTDPRRKIPGIFLGGIQAVHRHLHRRETDPLGAWGAVDVPIKSRVIHEDLNAAADEQDQEQEVHIVSESNPSRKTIRPRRRFRGEMRTCGYHRQPGYRPLRISGDQHDGESRHQGQERRDPDADRDEPPRRLAGRR